MEKETQKKREREREIVRETNETDRKCKLRKLLA